MLTVTPATFSKLLFDGDDIRAVYDDVRTRIDGLPDDLAIELVVDEDEPITVMAVTSMEPIVVEATSGMFEETRRPRTFGAELAANTVAAMLFEVRDRLDPAFGAPAPDADLDFRHRAAWSVYSYGRVARTGIRVHAPKHRYNLRNRLGFSDAADAVFDRLWAADDLTWADIERDVASVD